jgi:hypothetical protein
VQRLHDDELRQ